MGQPGSAAVARSVIRSPHPALRDFVADYHGYRYAGGEPGVHHGLPSTALTVVLSFDRPIDVGWLAAPASRRSSWAVASGLGMQPAGIYHDGTQHGIQLDVTPVGARALLGVPAAALRCDLVSLDAIIGARAWQLYDSVASARSWQARFAALDQALLALAAGHDARPVESDTTLRHAWCRLHSSLGRVSIGELADQVGWSRRHLSQRFGAEYGIGPKQAARLIRFGVATDLVADRSSLADVAARCGYADQAHLTREWRELAGLPPTAWLREEDPFLQDRPAGI